MEHVYLITGMAMVTFGIRYFIFPISGKINYSDRTERALRYVPPVVLTAIIIPSVLIPKGNEIQFTYHNPYLVGAFVTFVVGLVSKSLMTTIILGMAAFLFWQWVLRAGWI